MGDFRRCEGFTPVLLKRTSVRALLIGCALCALALGSASEAAAAAKHPALGNFGSANEPSFSSASGLAVDQSTGDVLVISEADHTLSRWHADGTAANFSALGTNVIDGKGGADATPQEGILGEYAGSKEVQVAVDNSGGATQGDIYVTDSSHGVVDIFASDGHYLGQLTAAGSSSFGESCGVTVDESGAVYVAEYAGGIHKFVPSGAFPVNTDNTSNFTATEPCTLAAGSGPTAGSLFVASWGGPVTKFNAATGTAEYVVASGSNTTVAVDPATGHAYVATGEVVKEYDASGGSSASLVSTISTSSTFTVEGVAVDGSSGRVYVARGGTPKIEMFGPLVEGEPPVATTGGVSTVGNTGAMLEGTVDPNESATTWQFEYGLTSAYGSVAPATPADAGEGAAPVPVSISVTGLQPGTEYHYRLRALNGTGPSNGADRTFTTAGPALAETTGSPIRTATTAQLEGRVLPTGAATSYHFEFGSQGSCADNPCQSTPIRSAGGGSEYVLVSEEVSGLEPGATYHYRLVADNGNIAGQAFGEDMTVTTRTSDAPPSPAPYPGPPGSDRGWEQVNVPDTNGNPVTRAVAISNDGDRVVYQVNGGTSETTTGTVFTEVLAERTASGWQNVDALPARDELSGPNWFVPSASSDLSTLILVNTGTKGATSFRVTWPNRMVEKLYQPGGSFGGYYETSADASRVIMRLNGSVDPDHPVSANPNLYDVSSGMPKMVSLLPGNTVPACGIAGPQPSVGALPENAPPRSVGWVSADGTRVLFPSEGNVCDNRSELYLRDLIAESTKLVSGPALSGPDCRAELAKMTGDAVFFWTRSRLASRDIAVGSCDENRGGDLYRYDLASGNLDCVTCVSTIVEADLPKNERFANKRIAVAGDGSRVYFQSPNRLLPGAASPGFYRVDVSTGNLRYIAPAAGSAIGDAGSEGEAMNSDGSVIIFRSDAPTLNPLGGSDNGGTYQYYRYDDRNQSLTCVSCPSDGSEPAGDVPVDLVAAFEEQAGPNLVPINGQGDFAFVTSTPIVPADHNSARAGQERDAGDDIYEWRDGRLFLVTDGTTQWVGNGGVNIPRVSGFTPSGRDLFFTVPEQLTADAVDGFSRLYDARLGGGFPPPAQPPESCTGSCEGPAGPSSSPPVSVSPATPAFSGPENPKPHFKHRKHRRHKHHHRRHRKKGRHAKSHRPQLTQSWRTSR